ncbi:type II toxin-antitoxin system Phd/YefM family antitoxin [Schleiferilactobacillus perolens]|uniref:type II toxin-antitoxin system Phd/YefM family antitoxin n=1 Tax=Schleiferilactobacillus perolens TaxID=100468 RepID=UPI00070D1938|nr:type II toxin-antitoxin system Phd/YefM family antitoxin [Schleiferilactobacillus perolens]
MKTTTFYNLRKNLKTYLDHAANHEPVLVTRKAKKSVVLMSQSNYDNMVENMHIFGNQANREWLEKSLRQYQNG